jgi:tetratricopeptide (TPR) repeat protein
VPDASQELEDWIAHERSRLRRAVVEGACTLARREDEARDAGGAAHWARRAVSLAPDDERAVRLLITALDKLGDGTGALRAYDDYARHLERELSLKPSPELRALATELRRRPTPADLGPLPAVTPAGPAASSPADTRPALRPAPRSLLPAAVAGVALVAIGALLALLLLPSASRSPGILAVGMIEDFTRGDSAVPASVVSDLLATSLARLETVPILAAARLYDVQNRLAQQRGRPASPHEAARVAGATELLTGSLHKRPGGGVYLDLQRADIASGAVRGGYRAEGQDLFAAVDRATAQVAGDFGVAPPSQPVADVTTRSLVAYRLYEEGMRAHAASDHTAAERLFQAALEEDSTFAMAAYGVWLAAPARGPAALERADRLADHATDRERLFIRQRLAGVRSEPRAFALAETLAIRYPTDPDAQLALASAYSNAGDFLRAIGPLRRALAHDSLLAGRPARCLACQAYEGLIGVYIWSDSLTAAERTAREWIRRQPASVAAHMALSAILEFGNHDAAVEALRAADSLDPAYLTTEPLRAKLALRRGDFAQADARLERLRAEGQWDDAEWHLALSLRIQGRLDEAAALPATRGTTLPAVLLLERGRPREAAAAFEAIARIPLATSSDIVGHGARHMAFQLTHLATSLAAAGDTARLAALADSVAMLGRMSMFGRDARLASYIRGLLLTARGRRAEAVEQYRGAVFSWNMGFTRVNYALATDLLALGRPTEAIAALQPALRGSLEASNLYLSRTEVHELLARAFAAAGQRDSAAAHYRAVVNAWRGADPPLRPRLEAAQRYLDAR